MNEQSNLNFGRFSIIKDIRQKAKVRHKLIDIIAIVIFAGICGISEWEVIEEWAKQRKTWLSKHLELPNGIPSHDTISRVFSWLKADEFYRCFMSWVNDIAKLTKGEIIAIDGKTLKGSVDLSNNKAAIHMVHAWACSNEILIGEVKTSEKSNEITAIPKLLELITIKDCIVTIDAMGTQKDIATQIIKDKSDYVLALKGNHPLLHQEVVDYFKHQLESGFEDVDYDNIKMTEKGHGRIEKREYWITEDIKWLDARKEWSNLKSIGMVESTRDINGIKSVDQRYYLCSIDADVNLFEKAVRSHWGIENKLHWCLDVVFKEDGNKIRKDNAPENMALVRRIALNLIKIDTTFKKKKSMRKKMFTALLDTNYLEILLQNLNKVKL